MEEEKEPIEEGVKTEVKTEKEESEEEKEFEREIREGVFRTALENSHSQLGRAPLKERREFIQGVVKNFLDEVFAAHLKGISDPEKRKEEMENLAFEIKEGLRRREPSFERSEEDHGALLHNLIGAFGTLGDEGGGTVGFILNSEKADYSNQAKLDRQGERDLQLQGIRRYLKTLNFIRGYALGFWSERLPQNKNKELQEGIIPYFTKPDFERFERGLRSLGFRFEITEEGALLPTDATDQEKEEIQRVFRSAQERAKEIMKKYEDETKKEVQERIAKIENKIETLAKERSVMENIKEKPLPNLQTELRQEEDNSEAITDEIARLEARLKNLEEEIKRTENELSGLQDELTQTPWYSWKIKGDLRKRVEGLNKQNQNLKTKKEDLTNQLAAKTKEQERSQTRIKELKEQVAVKEKYGLIRNIDRNLESLRNELEYLKKNYERLLSE